MVDIKNHTQTTWWIAKSTDNTIIHYGVVDINNIVESGQEELEMFIVEQEWIDRLLVLGITIEE